MSHLGRPKGKVLPEYSLKPVAKRLEQFLNRKVIMAKDCVGEEVENLVNTASGGEVILLENLRFHLEEEKNEESFAQKLAQLGDVLVNDAFGTAHRNHSSNVGVAKFLPAVAGFLLEKEIKYLDEAINNPTPPFTAILGGAKISGKIEIIENLLDKVDHLLIGGAMAFTFLKAQGKEVGKSKIEPDKIELASKTLALAKKRKVDFILPLDHLTVTEIKEEAEVKVEENISPDRVAVDIGPKTIKKFEEVLRESKTVVWNGPMGIFEMAPFKRGTEKIAAILSQLPATTIIGGGDSVAAVNQAGYADKITHISTGGGASLEFLEGKTLPGIAALKEK
jgi:phosphoglycerate kinase